MTTEQALEIFYKKFRYTNLNVLDDVIIYSFNTRQQAASVAKEAIELIQELDLNLQVQWESNSQLFDKTVLIKSK